MLHNLCLMHNDVMDIMVIGENQNQNQNQEFEIDMRNEGILKRNEIMNRLRVLI